MHRDTLPQLDGKFLVTDGGLETDLIFNHGFDLPQFAAFPLLATDAGRDALRRYFDGYADIAKENGVGLLLESPTWRSNPDWAPLLGLDLARLDELNREAIALMFELRAAYEQEMSPVVVSGLIGPRGDGYVVGDAMNGDEAKAYHSRQIDVFADAGVDLVSAITMTYADEAIGIVRAAQAASVRVVISFTVETDGRLPSGQPLRAAIDEVDEATDAGTAYFMINCAHPAHFSHVLDEGGRWRDRIVGLRANASMCSHAELDEAEELDEGDPEDLAARHAALRSVLPNLQVLGGCCGTDQRHVREIARAWLATA